MTTVLRYIFLFSIVTTMFQCSPKVKPMASNTKVKNNVRHEVVATAYNQVGAPYRYGGTSSKGFDCSGLVYYSFIEHDFTLPRTAHDMMNYGKKIDRQKVMAGDLAFFKNVGRKIDHVAIVYKIDRSGVWLLHSTTSKGVVLQSLDDSKYWSKRLVQFNRIISDQPM